MKIMLIDPPGFDGNVVGRILGSFGTNKADQAWPPYDLQIIAGYCNKHGHSFCILDANNLKLSWEEVRRHIQSFQPDWAVYLTCFQTLILDAQVAHQAKCVNPQIKTACVSLSIYSVEEPGKRLHELKDLDYIIWGEPELPLMQLINGDAPATVKGLYYKDSLGEVRFTGEAPKVKHLDEFGIPVHGSLPTSIYRCPVSIKHPMTIVNCSRGCINWCIHCQAGAFQRPMRYRSIDNVLEELREIKSIGIREIKFYDCSLPSNPTFCKELCKAMIAEKFDLSWNCNARAEKVNLGILRQMKAAGCHTICIGCESSSPSILKNMRKNETPEELQRAICLVKQCRMRVLIYLTFGLPGETAETMKQTYEFVKSLQPEFVTFGIVVPVPGTPFYDLCKDKGFLVEKKLHRQDPNALPSFIYPHLSPEEIHSFARRAYQRYYFRLGYFLQRLKNMRSLTEFYSCITNGIVATKRYFFEPVR